MKRNTNSTPFVMICLSRLLEKSSTQNFSEEVAQTVFKDLLSDFIYNFSIQSVQALPFEQSNKRYVTPYMYGVQNHFVDDKLPRAEKRVSEALASIVFYCLTFNLDSQIHRLVDEIVNDGLKVPMRTFENIYMASLKPLVDKLNGANMLAANPALSRLFWHLISTYIVRFVLEEPKPLKNWARPLSNCGSVCSYPRDGKALDNFLNDPRTQIARFSMNQHRRKHLESRLVGHEVNCETDQRSRPQVLVVTKTQHTYDRAHRDWKTRVQTLHREHLQRLGRKALETLLSDKQRKSIDNISMHILRPVVENLQSQAAAVPRVDNGGADNRILPPITKRKVPEQVVVQDETD